MARVLVPLLVLVLISGSASGQTAQPPQGLKCPAESAAQSTAPTYALSEHDFLCRLKSYSPNKELRPEASLMEPSKVLLFPHVLRQPPATASSGGLAIEVEFNETYFPWQNRTSARDLYFGGHTAKVGITPMYRVRILKEASAPVRVPSFMPKLTIFSDELQRRSAGQQWGEDDGTPKPITIKTIAFIPFGHHSNGQDGCLFADEQGVGYPTNPRTACPDNPDPDTIRINRRDGSFSTNYVELSYFYRRLKLAARPKDPSTCRQATESQSASDRYDRDCDGYDDRYVVNEVLSGVWDSLRRAKHSFLLGATYQLNLPFNTFGGAMEKPARAIYGMNRFRVFGGYEKYWSERGYAGPETTKFWSKIVERVKENGFKVRGWAEMTDKSRDTADCIPSGETVTALQCAPKLSWGLDLTIGLWSKADGLGLYTRYTRGQDYYNLSFPQMKDNKFQVGLSFSLSRSRGQAFPVITEDRIKAEKALGPAWDGYRDRVKKLSEGKMPKSSGSDE